MGDYHFHPTVRAWFDASFIAPTPCQTRAWAAFGEGAHTLVAAPTGSGKTLAAFMTAIDQLVVSGVYGELPAGVHTVYISPLKALGNDIQRNLAGPLEGIHQRLFDAGYGNLEIRTAVRTGDTPQAARTLMRRHPPHILVTTPESFYILLTTDSGREMLRSTRRVIVDEIHAIAGTKRGAHLSLSLERLAALTEVPPLRIGLSATQRPLDEIARYLVGAGGLSRSEIYSIVDEGHTRDRDLAIELPPAPLEAVLSTESSRDIYDRIAELISNHRTTLVFVNTRRMAERIAKALSDRLGADAITSHHGSMARELRLQAEQRLKAGELKALVATASLELGIDIGEVDLVCQIGSTRTLANLLQRVGRSGHRIGAIAKGRLFPQTRDELIECAALIDMTRRGELDRIEIAGPALDVLAQQLVAETASRATASLDELFVLCRGAYPYRDLSRESFDKVLAMLADGYSFARGRRGAYVHLDRINQTVNTRPGARLVAVMCGGAIPDTADYDVIVEPSGQKVGTVNEDFAIESLPGNIFQLGNSAWRVLKVDTGAVRVADAAGQPPNMPFWLGEAPARSVELSAAVARLRDEFAVRADATPVAGHQAALRGWLTETLGVDSVAADQIYDYLLSGYRALGAMPTQKTVIFERFFDESGGMQLVIHSPFGSRINRAWGLALRKRFCRQFNFELQAAAVEDAIVISLGAVHSFPLEDVAHYLKAHSVKGILIQAVLDAPLFNTRWRWVASCALALQRFSAGRKTAPRLMRMQAEDLVSVVFPDQLACAENLRGTREVPDHPLVAQTIHDCLHEAMDITGLQALLTAIEHNEVIVVARDVSEPSLFAQAVLNANPYAFLDDAPLEERRTQAVQSRRWIDPTTASAFGALDLSAIQRVITEVWPSPRNADELHDALSLLRVVRACELDFSQGGEPGLNVGVLATLFNANLALTRVLEVALKPDDPAAWIAAENYSQTRLIWPGLRIIRGTVPAGFETSSSREEEILALVRGWLEVCGPITAFKLAATLTLDLREIEHAFLTLETKGIVLRGRFTPECGELEWCDRRLLARIHRYTLNRLRAEIEPVSAAAFWRFLCEWQYVAPRCQVEGNRGAQKVLELLTGFEASAIAWEDELLPARITEYSPLLLDQLTSNGRFNWLRLSPRAGDGIGNGAVRLMPMTLVPRTESRLWRHFAAGPKDLEQALSANAQRVAAFLSMHGAAFFDDILEGTDLLKVQCEDALSELVANGAITSDSYVGLRVLLTSSAKRRVSAKRKRGYLGFEDASRWYQLGPARDPRFEQTAAVDAAENIARTLLRRYAIVFKRLLERESTLPPWRELLSALRRLETRGEVRGGRFVVGFSGEQFALPEAIESVRRHRESQPQRQLAIISATDPLNLIGIITPGVRIPAVHGTRIAIADGEAVAVRLGSEIRFLKSLSSEAEIRVRTAFLGSPSKVPSRRRAH
ncbi:MAG: DEAD/DEAH box helicase [Gammaproteobacteria bacterium]|nr:DEAD/DEAH box helicase [Gammaproteobacteria bacterium]